MMVCRDSVLYPGVGMRVDDGYDHHHNEGQIVLHHHTVVHILD